MKLNSESIFPRKKGIGEQNHRNQLPRRIPQMAELTFDNSELPSIGL